MEILEDWEDWDPSKGSFVHHSVAGSLAGVAEHCCMYPLDTIKTHMQCLRCGGTSVMQTGADLVRAEGFLRLFRGVSTMFSACIPAHALYFSLFEQCKTSFGANEAGHTPMAAAAAGAVATIVHDGVMVPFDTVKQRLQLGHFKGARDCIRQTVAKEGVKALFLSLPVALFHNIPYGACMVATNETVKEILNPSGEQNIPVFLASGAVAGGVAATITLPLDVIRTRLQTQDLEALGHAERAAMADCVAKPAPGCPARTEPGPVRYRGARDVIRHIKLHEGPSALFRGLVPRLAVHCPSVAISWSTYEFAKRQMQKWFPTV